jgi:hypothetical protein
MRIIFAAYWLYVHIVFVVVVVAVVVVACVMMPQFLYLKTKACLSRRTA